MKNAINEAYYETKKVEKKDQNGNEKQIMKKSEHKSNNKNNNNYNSSSNTKRQPKKTASDSYEPTSSVAKKLFDLSYECDKDAPLESEVMLNEEQDLNEILKDEDNLLLKSQIFADIKNTENPFEMSGMADSENL